MQLRMLLATAAIPLGVVASCVGVEGRPDGPGATDAAVAEGPADAGLSDRRDTEASDATAQDAGEVSAFEGGATDANAGSDETPPSAEAGPTDAAPTDAGTSEVDAEAILGCGVPPPTGDSGTPPSVAWVYAFGPQGNVGPFGPTVVGLATDSASELVVGGPGSLDGVSPEGGSYAFKSDVNGHVLWATTLAGEMTALSLDGQGNVYAILYEGAGIGSLTFSLDRIAPDGGSSTTPLVAWPLALAVDASGAVYTVTGVPSSAATYPNYDTSLSRLDSNGGDVWSAPLWTIPGTVQAPVLAIDPSGNVAAFGEQLVKYAPSGERMWTLPFSAPAFGPALAAAPNGDFAVTGTVALSGTATLAGCPIASDAPVAWFVAMVSSDGALRWLRWSPLALATGYLNVAVGFDSDGHVLAGLWQFAGPVNLGGAMLASSAYPALASYAADGTHLWSTLLPMNGTPLGGMSFAPTPGGGFALGGALFVEPSDAYGGGGIDLPGWESTVHGFVARLE